MYQYKECGLDDIKLVNGYQEVTTPYGDGVIIEDIPGLHAMLGRSLVRKPSALSGKELRFLRVELGFSQKRLASLLGVDEQTVGRWERGESEIHGAADRLVRALFAEYQDENSTVSEIVTRICELDRSIDELTAGLEHSENGWGLVA